MFSNSASGRADLVEPRLLACALALCSAALLGCAAERAATRPHAAPALRSSLSAEPDAEWSEGAFRPAPTATRDEQLPDELDQLIQIATDTSPIVLAARANLEASLERAPQVGGLPNPKLRGKYFVEQVETRVGPQEWALGIEQQFPALGMLEAQRKTADAQARAAGARLDAAILAVATEVKLAWYELYYLGRAIESVREDRDRLKSLEEVIRRDYASGSTSYTNLLRAQVELGRSESRLAGLEDQRRPKRARLNAALHRRIDAAVPTPRKLGESHTLLSPEELSRRMDERSPQLLGLSHDKQAAEEARSGAEFESRPAYSLGLEYIETGSAISSATPGSGDDPLALTFSIDLPIHQRRYSAALREARARSRVVSSNLEAMRDRLRSELEREHFIARDAERQIALYQDTLLPRARQAFEATETDFRSGQANFLELIDAERVLLEFDLTLERARTDRALAHARLQALVGQSVTTAAAPLETEERPQ